MSAKTSSLYVFFYIAFKLRQSRVIEIPYDKIRYPSVYEHYFYCCYCTTLHRHNILLYFHNYPYVHARGPLQLRSVIRKVKILRPGLPNKHHSCHVNCHKILARNVVVHILKKIANITILNRFECTAEIRLSEFQLTEQPG